MNPSDREEAPAAKIADLPREIQPQRDLWHGIEARIAPLARRSRWTEFAVAAGVAAFVSVAMFFWLERGGLHDQSDMQLAYRQLEATYRPLRAVALARYRGQAELLDPALRKTVDENLAIIDEALNEIRMTLADRPNDPALRQLLQWTYVQELAVIDAVTPQRTDGVVTAHYRGEL